MPARVTVGVPTYNRAEGLRRTVESVLAQSFRDFELLICDNASTDGTEALCAELAAKDPRVRYLRQPVNRGLTANFNAVFAEASGELVMALADDDWIEPDYLERCVAAHDADPSLALVSGSPRYHAPDTEPWAGVELQLTGSEAAARVRGYFAGVDDNVSIYGLMRRDALRAALPMDNKLAGDWLLCARLVMQGGLRTLPSTRLHRTVGGASANFAHTVRSMGLTEREARRPLLAIAGFIHADIARDAPVYAPLGPAGRRRLARASALAMLANRPLFVIQELLAPLLRRPRLRPVDLALRSVGRRLVR